MIFDTHAHYDDEQFDTDRDELLSSMAAGGVGTIVDAAATVESWDKIVELAEKYSFIYGSVGVHPDEVGALNEENFARMRELLKKEKENHHGAEVLHLQALRQHHCQGQGHGRSRHLLR